MENLKSLKEHLELFEKSRVKLFDNNREGLKDSVRERNTYADAIACCFCECARIILAGYFEVTGIENKSVVRRVYPTAIELYYHEEEGGFKDPIMYHTNYRKKTNHPDLPYFPIGSLNPHTSGIDITFENPGKHYRASFLIREYEVEYERSKDKITVKNSTDIYDDLLLNGITLDKADGIKWIPGKELGKDKIERRWRRNVADYDNQGEKKKAEERDEESFSIGGKRYKKCPFDWQFRLKDTKNDFSSYKKGYLCERDHCDIHCRFKKKEKR